MSNSNGYTKLWSWSEIYKTIQAYLNIIKMSFILLKEHVTFKYQEVINENEQ